MSDAATSEPAKSDGEIREAMVNNGINFWTHPQVQGTPVAQRIEFLTGKGLTKLEIEEVRRRVASMSGAKGGNEMATENKVKSNVTQTPTPNIKKDDSGVTSASSGWMQNLVRGAALISAGIGLSQMIHPHPRAEKYVSQVKSLAGFETSAKKKITPPSKRQHATDNGLDDLDIGIDDEDDDLEKWMKRMPQHRAQQRRRAAESLEVKGLRTELERLQRVIEQQESTMKEMKDNFRSMERRSEEVARSQKINEELASIKTLLMTRQIEENVRVLGASPLHARSTPTHLGGTVTPSHSVDGGGLVAAAENGPSLVPSTSSSKGSVRPWSSVSPTMDQRLKAADETPTFLQSHLAKSAGASASSAPDVPESVRKEFDEFRTAFEKLCASNSQSSLDSAKPVFQLYLANLVKHPDVPRYRRISTSNKSFKDSVAELKSHEDVLAALGFKTRGIHWEYRPSDTDEVREKFVPLVDACRKMLVAAVSTHADSDLPPVPVPTPHAATVIAEAAAHATVPSVSPARHPVTTDVDSANTADRLHASSAMSKRDDEDAALETSVSEDTIAPSSVALDEKRDSKTAAAGGSADAASPLSKIRTSDARNKDGVPKNISEVYAMLQRGEKLPGVRKIPDRLSEDSPSTSSAPAIPKPWAAASGSNEGKIVGQ
eukprot:g1121.t1